MPATHIDLSLLCGFSGGEARSGYRKLAKYWVRGYSADSLEECIIAAARADKEGALGIICAPILAPIVERIVDCPVAIIKPHQQTIIEAVETVAKRI
ncbi:hypothetical protein [Methanoculleus sp.]|uniref:hypothetical protein n=1 Tax=Methanoculleus sp. TaxID=90427 RepID=UPI002FC7E414